MKAFDFFCCCWLMTDWHLECLWMHISIYHSITGSKLIKIFLMLTQDIGVVSGGAAAAALERIVQFWGLCWETRFLGPKCPKYPNIQLSKLWISQTISLNKWEGVFTLPPPFLGGPWLPEYDRSLFVNLIFKFLFICHAGDYLNKIRKNRQDVHKVQSIH